MATLGHKQRRARAGFTEVGESGVEQVVQRPRPPSLAGSCLAEQLRCATVRQVASSGDLVGVALGASFHSIEIGELGARW